MKKILKLLAGIGTLILAGIAGYKLGVPYNVDRCEEEGCPNLDGGYRHFMMRG